VVIATIAGVGDGRVADPKDPDSNSPSHHDL
jgi:hypothetical protein